jgi:FMN phosphatase YigB (HAD superfamily)
MDKLIVTDCDGVLLNWEKAFHEWMTHKEYELQKSGPQTTYHFEDSFGVTRDKGRELVREFNESSAIGFLEPFRDAIENVMYLSNKGYVFDIVTSLGSYEYSVKLREMNLQNVFGEDVFREIVCLGLGEDKYDYLKYRYGTNSDLYWIEDKPSNAEDGARLGMRSILIEHLHNKDFVSDQHIRRAENWREIRKIILTNA